MPFRPEEIARKVFVTTLRGYARHEVEDYLHAVAEDYAALIDEVEALRHTVVTGDQGPTPAAATVRSGTSLALVLPHPAEEGLPSPPEALHTAQQLVPAIDLALAQLDDTSAAPPEVAADLPLADDGPASSPRVVVGASEPEPAATDALTQAETRDEQIMSRWQNNMTMGMGYQEAYDRAWEAGDAPPT